MKCPYKRKFESGSPVPKHYMSQLQLNMFICNCREAHYFEWFPPQEPFWAEKYNLVRVPRSLEYWERHILTPCSEFMLSWAIAMTNPNWRPQVARPRKRRKKEPVPEIPGLGFLETSYEKKVYLSI